MAHAVFRGRHGNGLASRAGRISSSTSAFAVMSICAALLAGRLFITHRTLVVLAAVLFAVLPLLFSPRLRICFLVFGGLLVFQSSETLSAPKLFFLFGAAVSAAGALARAQTLTHEPAYHDVAPLFRASRAFIALILVSLLVSLTYQTPHKSWLRDAAPYLLFSLAPLFAFDAQTAFSKVALRRLLAIAGLSGSAAFAAQWLSNRGIVKINAVFGLPTFLLGAALFAFAMAVVLEGDRRRLRWLVLAALILAAFLSSGSRSTLVILVAPVAIVLGARGGFARRSIRLAITLPVISLLVVLGIQSFVRQGGANQEVLTSRIQLLFHSGQASDQSFVARQSQGEAAWKLFKESPLFGFGPGYPITWVGSTGITRSSTTLDSPVAYLVKFGVLGLWPVIVLAWSVRSVLRRLRARTGRPTVGQLGLIGFAGVFVVWCLLGVPFDDKGLTGGFLLLLAVALSEPSAPLERLDERAPPLQV